MRVSFVEKIDTILAMIHKALALLAIICSFAIQTHPAVQDSELPKISVSVDLVKVPISVFDHRGFMVTDLKRENFRIWEDQVPQEIRSFGLEVNPVSVVLLLDTSNTGKAELKKIKEAAEEFAGALSKGDRISLITFDDEVNSILDWTDNPKKSVQRALSRIKPGFRTALYDAMYVAAMDQLKGIDGRKAIILLTDCLNNQSVVGFHEASVAILQSQASLYVVSKTAIVRQDAKRMRRVVILNDIYKRITGEGNYIDEFFQKLENEMSSLTEQTGGRCLFANDYDDLTNHYLEVAKELKSKYFLTYVSNQNLSPNTYHRISLEYTGPASKVGYRKGYYYQPKTVPQALRPQPASN